jgi:hypothetical protein
MMGMLNGATKKEIKYQWQTQACSAMIGSPCPDDMEDFSPELFSCVTATRLRELIVGR